MFRVRRQAAELARRGLCPLCARPRQRPDRPCLCGLGGGSCFLATVTRLQAGEGHGVLARLRAERARESERKWTSAFCDQGGSAHVSSEPSGFPGHWASGCKERRNMGETRESEGAVMCRAEGGTLIQGGTQEPNSALPGRFPKTPCQNSANGAPGGLEDKGRDACSAVQRQRNGTGVQESSQGELASASVAACARDYLAVYGAPSELWALALRFGRLASMSAGEQRGLDECYRLRFFGSEASALVTADGIAPVVLTPSGVWRWGQPLAEEEEVELAALLGAACDHAEALNEEAELFRAAVRLLGPCANWTTHADCRDAEGAACEPHPDAATWSLVGAVRQAQLDRESDLCSPAPWRRLRALTGIGQNGSGETLAVMRSELRGWNDAQSSGSAVRALLLRAAAEAQREADGEVF